MTIKGTLVLALGIITLLLTAGCADVTTTQKVGDFGTVFGSSSEEQKAIDWFKSTYGDPTTNDGDAPRFIEPLITSGISDKKLPVDKVTVFPASGGSVYFFVIYDNFAKGDPITVRWTYLETGKDVTWVQEAAGGDFGRFIVEFQKPDTGWGKGRQRMSVKGEGATADVEFTIADKLTTVPLPYNPVTAQATTVTTITTTAPTTPATASCNAGFQMCSGTCRNILEDKNNCGSCGFVCPDINGQSSCVAGLCRVAACNSGWGDCNHISGDGCEANFMTDVRNCGSCGNWCPRRASDNAIPYCTQGYCEY